MTFFDITYSNLKRPAETEPEHSKYFCTEDKRLDKQEKQEYFDFLKGSDFTKKASFHSKRKSLQDRAKINVLLSYINNSNEDIYILKSRLSEKDIILIADIMTNPLHLDVYTLYQKTIKEVIIKENLNSFYARQIHQRIKAEIEQVAAHKNYLCKNKFDMDIEQDEIPSAAH